MGVSENGGFSPQIIHLFIGFSIRNSIHFGVPVPLFLNVHPYEKNRGFLYQNPPCQLVSFAQIGSIVPSTKTGRLVDLFLSEQGKVEGFQFRF